jgi:hypothetical protein
MRVRKMSNPKKDFPDRLKVRAHLEDISVGIGGCILD